MTQTKTLRKSGIELLKIIALLLICISHSNQTYRTITGWQPSLLPTEMLLHIVRYFGAIGNILFIICSSYFLLDSKKSKTEKIFNILLDSALISIGIYLFAVTFSGYKINNIHLKFMQFLPDLFSVMWFIPTYAIFYAVHPFLNIIINSMNQKQHFAFCVAILIFLSIPSLFINIDVGLCNLSCFFVIYFIVGYQKRYCSSFQSSVKINLIVFIVCFSMFILLVFLNNFLLIKCNYIQIIDSFDLWYSPILIPALISLFNLFNSMKFSNRFINYLSSCSLFIYCIHENYVVRNFYRVKYFNHVLSINPNIYLLWIALCAIILFVVSSLLSILYKETIHRLTRKLALKCSTCFNNTINKLYNSKLNVADPNNTQNNDNIDNNKTS